MNYFCKKGLTIIELLIVISILTALIFVSFQAFKNTISKHAIEKTQGTAVSLLSKARQYSKSARNDTTYGVYFQSDKMVLFTGSTYSTSTANESIDFNSNVKLSSKSLVGGGNSIIFNKADGTTDMPGTLTFSLTSSSATKNITVYATGLIETN